MAEWIFNMKISDYMVKERKGSVIRTWLSQCAFNFIEKVIFIIIGN
jgi:hypothetical protein